MMRTKQNQISHENSDFTHNKQNDPLFKAARASVEDCKSLLLLSSAMSKAIKAKHNAEERIIRSAKNEEDNHSIMSAESGSSLSSSQSSRMKPGSNPLHLLFSRRHQHHRHQLAFDDTKSENSPFPTASVSTPTLRSKSKAISRRLVNFLPLKHNHNKYSASDMDTTSAATSLSSSSTKSKPTLLSQKSLEFEALLEEYPTRTIKASLTPCTAA